MSQINWKKSVKGHIPNSNEGEWLKGLKMMLCFIGGRKNVPLSTRHVITFPAKSCPYSIALLHTFFYANQHHACNSSYAKSVLSHTLTVKLYMASFHYPTNSNNNHFHQLHQIQIIFDFNQICFFTYCVCQLSTL